MIVVEVLDVLGFRRWEQVKRINFGRLFSYISEVREIQKQLECGKMFPASYLATYARYKDKNYILVIDMIKGRDSVFGNKPIIYAQLVIGHMQVIVRMKDLNSVSKETHEVIYDSDEKVLKIARGLLDLFRKDGVTPIKTADLYFGVYESQFQTSFDDTFELIKDDEMKGLVDKLAKYGFLLDGNGCMRYVEGFTINISHRNIYKDYIVSLTDSNDRSNIHWAIKDENLKEFVAGLGKIYETWIEEKNI